MAPELFKTDETISAGITASHTILLPLPRIQLIAAGFLSVHIFPVGFAVMQI